MTCGQSRISAGTKKISLCLSWLTFRVGNEIIKMIPYYIYTEVLSSAITSERKFKFALMHGILLMTAHLKILFCLKEARGYLLQAHIQN